MGLEKRIADMSKKRLELLKNLVSVGVIICIAYAAITLAGLRDPLDFFETQAFIYICITLLLLSIVWKLLNGAKMHFPNDLKKKDTPVKKEYEPKQRQSYQRPKKSTTIGSWLCPKCGTFVIGDRCPKCKYRR